MDHTDSEGPATQDLAVVVNSEVQSESTIHKEPNIEHPEDIVSSDKDHAPEECAETDICTESNAQEAEEQKADVDDGPTPAVEDSTADGVDGESHEPSAIDVSVEPENKVDEHQQVQQPVEENLVEQKMSVFKMGRSKTILDTPMKTLKVKSTRARSKLVPLSNILDSVNEMHKNANTFSANAESTPEPEETPQKPITPANKNAIKVEFKINDDGYIMADVSLGGRKMEHKPSSSTAPVLEGSSFNAMLKKHLLSPNLRKDRRSQSVIVLSPSQQLKILNQDTEFKEALLDLNNSSTPTDWILFNYTDNLSIKVSAQGSAGLNELKSHFEPSQAQYALLKVYVDETGYGGSPKIVFISWVGPGVTGKSKGRSAPHRALLLEACSDYVGIAGEYPLNDTTDTLTHEGVIGKLTGLKGKDTSADSPLITRSNTATPTSRSFGGRDSTLQYDTNVDEAIKGLGGENIRWVMLNYTPDDPYKVCVAHTGDKATTQQFAPLMNEQDIFFVIMRLGIGDGVKAAVITYVGVNAHGFSKARSAGHRVNLYEHCKKLISISGEFAPQNLEDLTDANIINKILGGANEDAKSESSTPTAATPPFRMKQPDIKIENLDQFSGVYKDIDFKGRQEVMEAINKLVESQSDMNTQIEHLNASNSEILVPYVKLSIGGPKFRTITVTETDFVGNTGALVDQKWRDAHLEPKDSFFVFLAVVTSEAGYGLATKWVLVQWIGHLVKRLARGQIGELRQTVLNLCTGIVNVSGELQGCTLPEHLTLPLVQEKLTGSLVRGDSMKLERRQSKFQGFGKEKKSELVYKDIEQINAAIDAVVSENRECDWLVIGYVQDTIDCIELVAKGKGDCKEFERFLKPDQVCFVLMSIMHATGYHRDFAHLWKPYYGMILWKGAKISLLEKGLTGHHFNAFQKHTIQYLTKKNTALQGSHYQAETLEELTMERIKKTFRLFD
ncbi:CoaA [Acrasis kona]|uniref:CoaA n=1 Tax=Acrasis kona TaxID=1008807 RepID=A0AAW2ZEE7_9EUKA